MIAGGAHLHSRIGQSKTATEAQIGLLKRSKNSFLLLNLFRLTFSTGSQSNKSVENVVLNPSHRSSHQKAHTYTPTYPYHTPVYNSADAGLAAITVAASRRKSPWRSPSSARQQRVLYDGSSARYRCHFANNGCACCSYLWRLSAE